MNYYTTSVRIDEETKSIMVKTLEITGESQSDFIKTSIIERCEKVAKELERIRESMDKFAELGLVTKTSDGNYSVDKSQMVLIEKVIKENEN